MSASYFKIHLEIDNGELQRFVYCLLCFVFVFCSFIIFVCLCFFIGCRTDDWLYNEAYITIYIFYHNPVGKQILLTIQEL